MVQVDLVPDARGLPPEAVLEEWRTLHEVADGAVKAGAEVTLVVASRHHEASFRRGEVEVRFVRPSRFERGVVPAAIGEVIASRRPHVLHLHGLSFPRQTLYLAARVRGARLVAQDHFDKPLPGWRRRAQRLAFSTVDAFMFTEQQQARPFVEAGVLDESAPVFEVMEGSTAFTPGDREQARGQTGLHGDPCVLWVGNLHPTKDPLTGLAAVRVAARELPGIHLWCCYRSSPLLEQVQRVVEGDAILRGRVHLLGAKTNAELEAYYRSADLFLLASRAEGGAYSAVEAIACGAVPILSDISVFRRFTAGGTIGANCPVGDAAAFGEAIVTWARRDLGAARAAARAHFEAELSLDAQSRQLARVYESVCR